MMTTNMKMMNDMELEMIAGGIPAMNQQWADVADGTNEAPDGFFEEAVSTAWEVVKHVLFDSRAFRAFRGTGVGPFRAFRAFRAFRSA